MKVEVQFTADDVKNQIKPILEAYASTCGLKAEAYAKINRPWKDRTSNARNSIRGGCEWKGDDLSVYVSGNVEYFIYLELANQKRYAILVPTLEKHASEFVEGYRRIFK